MNPPTTADCSREIPELEAMQQCADGHPRMFWLLEESITCPWCGDPSPRIKTLIWDAILGDEQ